MIWDDFQAASTEVWGVWGAANSKSKFSSSSFCRELWGWWYLGHTHLSLESEIHRFHDLSMFASAAWFVFVSVAVYDFHVCTCSAFSCWIYIVSDYFCKSTYLHAFEHQAYARTICKSGRAPMGTGATTQWKDICIRSRPLTPWKFQQARVEPSPA